MMDIEAAQWRPSASMRALRHRAQVLVQLRRFMLERDVWEVEVPTLARFTVSDPGIHSAQARFPQLVPETFFPLQTSPEHFMKRLLAAGSGSIYSLGKAFRDGESGRFHNPEFTLLEWYRVGWDHHGLMTEVAELVHAVLGPGAVEKRTYREVFQRMVGFDPLGVELPALRAFCEDQGLSANPATERDEYLDFVLSRCIQPKLGPGLVFLHQYPESQAALARSSDAYPGTADRFEAFFGGIEIANGYYELNVREELEMRFAADGRKRRALGLPEHSADPRFLEACEQLPSCAGVALGVDRLVMLKLDATHMDEVIAFPFARA